MLAAWGSPVSESSLCGVVLQEDDPSYSSAYVAGLEESNCLSTPVSMDRPNAENSNSSVICRSRTKGKYETVKNVKRKGGGEEKREWRRRIVERIGGTGDNQERKICRFASNLTRELFIVAEESLVSD